MKNNYNRNEYELMNQLIKSPLKYDILFDLFPNPIFMIEEGSVFDCNKAAVEKFGYHSKGDIVRLGLNDLSPYYQPNGERSEVKVQEMLTLALESGRHMFEWTYQNRDGGEIYSEVLLVKMPFEGKQVVTAIIRDIGDRKELEKERKSKWNLYKSLFKNHNAIMMLIDPQNGKIVDANPATYSFYGYSREELLNLKITDINILNTKEILKEMERAKKEKKTYFNFRHKLKNGEIRDVEVYSDPVKLHNKEYLYSIIHDVSEKKEIEKELRLRTTYFQGLFESSPEAILILDEDRKVVRINKAFTKLFKYTEKEIKGKDIAEAIIPKDVKIIEGTLGSNSILNQITTRKDKNGKIIDVEMLTYPIIHDYNQVGLYVIYRDISVETKQRQRLELFAKLFENNVDGVVITNKKGNIKWINRAFSLITGYSYKEVIGKNPRILKSGRHDKIFYKNMWKSILKDGVWQSEIWNKRKNGEVYPEHLTIISIKNQFGDITHFAAIFKDITKDKEKEKKIKELAMKDSLTGLYNRLYFSKELEEVLLSAKKNNKKVSVIFIDLDDFKTINDNLGHSAGDEALINVAKRIKNSISLDAILSRYGGDEFVIALRDFQSEEDILETLDNIISNFRKPFNIVNLNINISMSIGVSFYPDDSDEQGDLIRKADIAMYECKNNKKCQYVFYNGRYNKKRKSHNW